MMLERKRGWATPKCAKHFAAATLLTLLGAVSAGAVFAQASWPRPEDRRYEDMMTFKHRKVFAHDPWVWGYTKEFAELFRMPDRWIEPELSGGLLAIAFRMTEIGRTDCGLGGKEDNCWPALRCQFDLYYDTRTPLPWIHPDIHQFMMDGVRSSDFLVLADPRLERPGSRQRSNVFPGFSFRYHERGTNRHGGELMYYDRKYQPGIGLLGVAGYCPEQPARAKFYFYDMEAREKAAKGEIRFFDAKPVLTWDVPESYLKRANAAFKRDEKPNQAVIERLKRQFFESRGLVPNETKQ